MVNTGKVIEVVEFINENYEKPEASEEKLKKRFGDSIYKQFSEYCLGGAIPYACNIGGKYIKLTQEGVRELHRLKERQIQLSINKNQMLFNVLLFFTSITSLIISSANNLITERPFRIMFVSFIMILLLFFMIYPLREINKVLSK